MVSHRLGKGCKIRGRSVHRLCIPDITGFPSFHACCGQWAAALLPTGRAPCETFGVTSAMVSLRCGALEGCLVVFEE